MYRIPFSRIAAEFGDELIKFHSDFSVQFQKIKKLVKHPLTHELRDVRVLSLIAFGVIVLLVSWSGVRVIEINYQLQQQLSRMQEQNKLRQLENANKNLENQYYQGDQYLELQARKQFGKAAPGETLLLVPKEVALKHTTDLPQKDLATQKAEAPAKPFYQQNFEAWMRFFFHRPS